MPSCVFTASGRPTPRPIEASAYGGHVRGGRLGERTASLRVNFEDELEVHKIVCVVEDACHVSAKTALARSW